MIRIRPLKEKDIGSDVVDLSRLFFEEYQKYHRDYFAITALKDIQVKKFFYTVLKARNSQALIALDGARVIGYITFSIQKRESFKKLGKVGYISGLMVSPQCRRKGIGNALFKKAKAWFREKGVPYFYLETSVNNRNGIAFYRTNKMRPLRTQYIGEV